MKTTIKDLTNLIKVATFTNSPQSNEATLNERGIKVTYHPNHEYQFQIKFIEGDEYRLMIFEKREVLNVRNVWNEFMSGKDAQQIMTDVFSKQATANSL